MIRILSQDTINRLAAGEIIHSYAQACKELIENAVDAGAKSIALIIDNNHIEIQNDNSQIGEKDHKLLCRRFCTSKIREFTDLLSATSFGFRGEALSAMSYVATVVCRSGGFESIHRNGEIVSLNEQETENTLFEINFNELECESSILKTLEAITCVNYQLAFNLQCNGINRIIPEREDIEEAVSFYFSEQCEALHIKKQDFDFYIFFCKSAKASLCFINNKYLPQQQLLSVVISYVNRIEKNQKFAVCVYGSISSQLIDVNVHPQKLKILIKCESEIVELVDKEVMEYIKAKSETLEQIQPVVQRQIEHKDSPLNIVRISSCAPLSTQVLPGRIKFYYSRAQFKCCNGFSFKELGKIFVIGAFNDRILFEKDLRISSVSSDKICPYLLALIVSFIDKGLYSVSPLVQCESLENSELLPMKNKELINPIPLIKSPKLQKMYHENSKDFIPKVTLLNLNKNNPQDWLALFASKLFENVKNDRELMQEIYCHCEDSDIQEIIEHEEILKMFNRI